VVPLVLLSVGLCCNVCGKSDIGKKETMNGISAWSLYGSRNDRLRFMLVRDKTSTKFAT
jgi:hypothetical protein